jgi:integrase
MGAPPVIAGLHVVGSGRPGNTKRWYIYAWRGGKQIGVRVGGPRPKALTAAEVNAYHAAKAAVEAKPTNTVAALIRDYRASPEWMRLTPNTKKQWGYHLDRIEDRWGKVPLDVVGDPRMRAKVIAWRDERASTPRSADYQVGVLRSLLGWGLIRGRVASNAAQGVPKLYGGGERAEIVWEAKEVERFVAETPEHIGDIVRLAAITGFRAADLAALTWSEVKDNMIVREAEKKSRGKRRTAIVPLVGSAQALLAELRGRHRVDGVETVLVNSRGRPWSTDGLSGRVASAVKRLDIRADDGRLKHLHDLRGTLATKLFALGLNDGEVAEIVAWSPAQVASIRHHYVDRKRRIVALAERLEAAEVKRLVKQAAAD